MGAAVVATCPVHLPGPAAAVLIVAATILLVNGVNLLDGLDMLAAGVVAVAAASYAVMLHGSGRQLAVALAASLLGFLAFNRPPARVYLGDGGSYLLGSCLTVLLALAWRPGATDSLGVAALAVVAVPVGEVAFAVARRLRARRSPLAGDRGHPYDRLVARGWPYPAASLAYIGMEAILAAGAVVAARRASLVWAVALDLVAAGLLVWAAAVIGALGPNKEARS